MRLLLLISLLLLMEGLTAQSQLKGLIQDGSEKKPMSNAVVSILRKKDSVLVSFQRTNVQGGFAFSNLKPDSYIIQVSYPKYADFADSIQLTSITELNMPPISMIQKATLLQEVVVSQKLGAIRMKGDTLEFKADSFLVREGANVEALLKKLPGLQVNSKGEITAQGEKVQKILVDGEEFFSDDPAIVTQTLRADAIDKVQVFDKTSEQAAFTGIDDGERTKTINLQLKEDKKRGYFGKAKLGGGTPNWFENEAMINLFKGKKRLAAYGTMSNTGRAGLNWEDQDRFGGGNNMEYNEEEGYFMSWSENDEFNTWGGRYNGEGLPKAWKAGIHFSDKKKGDSIIYHGNYQFQKQNVAVQGLTRTKNILPNVTFNSREDRITNNSNTRHQAGGAFEIKLDSTQSIKVTVNGNHSIGQSDSRYNSESFNESNVKINSGDRSLQSDGTRNAFNTNAIWRKKLHKKGRTLSWSLDQNFNNNQTEGFLRSDFSFYDTLTGNVIRRDTVDQRKASNGDAWALQTRAAYTEPLSKYTTMELSYGYRMSNSEAQRQSFDKNTNNDPKYDVIAPAFSSHYDFSVLTHSPGVSVKYNKGKLNLTAGGTMGFTQFQQKDLDLNTTVERNFTNLFPKVNLTYKIKPQTNLRVRYNGATQQPSMEQIQPLIQNNDELNQIVGNPELDQQFNHNLNINFNDYKVLSGRNFYIGTYINMIANPITNRSIVNPSTGKRVSQFINLSGKSNLNGGGWFGFWKQIEKWNANTGFNGNFNFSRFYNIVNGITNVTNSRSIDISPSISFDKENKYSIYFQPNLGYTRSVAQLQNIVTEFFTSESSANASYEITKRWVINTEITYNWRQETFQLPAFRAWKWDAGIMYKVFKNRDGEIKLSVFDILNQNLGITRNTTSNFISENSFNTLRRYWLLSFAWNFSKTPSVKE